MILDKSQAPFLSAEQMANLQNRPDKPMQAQIWEKVGYQPNAWALYHVHSSRARFNAYCTSRQAGKTTAIWYELLAALYAPPRDNDQTHQRDADGVIIRRNANVVGVFSDTFEHAELVVMPFVTLLTTLIGESAFTMNKNQHILRVTATGAELRWFSAENPRAGQGHTFSDGFFDESQNIGDDFWINLRPAFGARLASIYAFGTPDPIVESSWFEGLYLRGQEDDPNYYSYTIPCWQNKWLPTEDIEDALGSLSEREFRMKYLGEWMKAEGAVFHNPEVCFTGAFVSPEEAVGGNNIIGLDLAKSEDNTVAVIFDTKHSKELFRWKISRLDYVKVADEVERLYHAYRCHKIRMDTTGLGEPVADMLRKRDLHITPYVFSNKSKERMVSHLAREIEHKRLVLAKEDTQLLRELKAFTRTVSKAGNVMFSAPVNFHDDHVCALGLAALDSGRSGSVVSEQYAFGEPTGAFA